MSCYITEGKQKFEVAGEMMNKVCTALHFDMLRQIDCRYELYLLEDFDDRHIMLRNPKDEQLAVRLDGYGDMYAAQCLLQRRC